MLARAGESTTDITPCTCSPGPWRRGTEGDWSQMDRSDVGTHKMTFPSALGRFGRSRRRAACRNIAPVSCGCNSQGDTNLPDGISCCQEHTEGGDRSGSSPAGEEPGVGVSACLPHSWSTAGDAFQDDAFHNHELQGHLPTALPERNCVTPERFWGSKPLFISCFPTACQTHVCPLSTGQPQPLAETWIVFAFPFWGFASCPGNITIPEQAHFSVLSCFFVLA